MTISVLNSRLKTNLYKMVHDIQNEEEAQQILKKFDFDKVVSLVEDNVSNGILSNSAYEVMVKKLGIQYLKLDDKDIMEFRSLIYGVNDVIMSWIALTTFDNKWDVPMPPELLQLLQFLLKKLFVFENKVALPNSRPIELSPAFVSFDRYVRETYLIKYQTNEETLNSFEKMSNLYIKQVGFDSPFVAEMYN